MRLPILLPVLVLSLFFPLAGHCNDATPIDSKTSEKTCTYTREYITTLEYLRANKDLAIPEPDAQKLALQVSQGCTGAAKRFIKITTALLRSGATGNNAIETGTEFAKRTDPETQTFISVFSSSYSEEYLDLDLQAALRLARALMADFNGDVPALSMDFEKLVKFCVGEKDLNLPRPQCAPFASRITRLGEKYAGGVAEPFVKTFTFLRSATGPDLTTQQALELTEKIVAGGKISMDNFIQAFKYGISSRGLGIPVREALHFAQKMANPSEKTD